MYGKLKTYCYSRDLLKFLANKSRKGDNRLVYPNDNARLALGVSGVGSLRIVGDCRGLP